MERYNGGPTVGKRGGGRVSVAQGFEEFREPRLFGDGWTRTAKSNGPNASSCRHPFDGRSGHPTCADVRRID